MQILQFLYAPIILLFVFLTSFTLSAQANWQAGSITLKTGAVIQGEIDDRDWGIGPYKIFFRTAETESRKTYEPADLIGFSTTSGRYFSGKLRVESGLTKPNTVDYSSEPTYRTDDAFFRQLIDGEKKLYVYVDRSAKEHLVIGEPDAPQVLDNYVFLDDTRRNRIQDVKFRRELADYLPGCPSVEPTIGNLAYDVKKFVTLFEKWYACRGSKPDYQATFERISFAFAPVVGVGLTVPQYASRSNLVSREWNSGISPYIGFSAQLRLPVRRNRFKFNLDVLYTSYSVSGVNVITERSSSSTFNEIDIEESTLEFYLGPQIDFYLGEVPMPVGIGISRGYFFDHSLNVTETRQVTGSPDFVRNIIEDGSRSTNAETGFYADVGLRFGALETSLRYHFTLNIYPEDVIDLKLHRFMMMGRYWLGK